MAAASDHIAATRALIAAMVEDDNPDTVTGFYDPWYNDEMRSAAARAVTASRDRTATAPRVVELDKFDKQIPWQAVPPHRLSLARAWPARHRLVAGLEFLVEHIDKRPAGTPVPTVVVCAGDPPYLQYKLLAQLFTTLTFHIYGTGAPADLSTHTNIRIHDEPLTRAEAGAWSSTRPLFISDEPNPAVQMACHQAMAPVGASLRIGHPDKKMFACPMGTLRVFPWADPVAGEGRVFTSSTKWGRRPSAQFRDWTFHHNIIWREWTTFPPAGVGRGGDRCCDCTHERMILEEFVAARCVSVATPRLTDLITSSLGGTSLAVDNGGSRVPTHGTYSPKNPWDVRADYYSVAD